MKKHLPIIYVITILVLPWLTTGGYFAFFFMFSGFPIFIITTIFVLKKYKKDSEKDFRWLYFLLGLYTTAFLFIQDGGDGPSRQGFEILYSHVIGKHYIDVATIISAQVGKNLAEIALCLFLLFFILNIYYIFRKR